MSHDMTPAGLFKRLLLGAIIIVIASGCTRSTTHLPAPPGSATANAPSGSANVEPVPEVMKGGRYLFEAASLEIVATGPDGWVGYPSWAMDGPEPVRADAPTGIGISF